MLHNTQHHAVPLSNPVRVSPALAGACVLMRALHNCEHPDTVHRNALHLGGEGEILLLQKKVITKAAVRSSIHAQAQAAQHAAPRWATPRYIPHEREFLCCCGGTLTAGMPLQVQV